MWIQMQPVELGILLKFQVFACGVTGLNGGGDAFGEQLTTSIYQGLEFQ